MSIKVDMSLDCKGLACPMPIVKTKKAIEGLTPGQVIEVKATDKGSTVDIKSWASKVGHQYIGTKHEGDVLVHYVRKANEHEVNEAVKYPHTITNAELQSILSHGEE
ncbi:sulfurtransferase TusA family protein, partial [Bacillus thuringiensis]|nr:sulfurtransferase TusA family protein [Bacillus thuringiensis]